MGPLNVFQTKKERKKKNSLVILVLYLCWYSSFSDQIIIRFPAKWNLNGGQKEKRKECSINQQINNEYFEKNLI